MAEIDAAGEGDGSIRDEQFAVVAEIDGGDAPGREERRGQEFVERNFVVPQPVSDGRPGISRAGGVNQDADGHAAGHGAGERGDKLPAAGVVVENVGAERDGFFGRFDGGEHGGKGGVAVDERFDLVAGGEGLGDEATDGAREHFEMFRAFVLRFAEIFGNGTAEGFVDGERQGAAADAVDAEREVKNWAEQRQKPDESQPERGGAGIALVEQGMNRGENGGQEIEARRDVRPEPGDFVEPVHCHAQFPTEAGAGASSTK